MISRDIWKRKFEYKPLHKNQHQSAHKYFTFGTFFMSVYDFYYLLGVKQSYTFREGLKNGLKNPCLILTQYCARNTPIMALKVNLLVN